MIQLNKKGFTLVELLVCLVVIGIVCGIGFGLVRGTWSKPMDTIDKISQNEIYDAAKTYVLESNVSFYSNPNKEFKLELVGCGKLIYENDSLKYIGTYLGKDIEKEFNLNILTQFPFSPNVRFNIPDEDGMLEFVPDNKQEVFEWATFIDAYHTILCEVKEDAAC